MIGNWYIYKDEIKATVMDIEDGIYDNGKLIPPDSFDTLNNQAFSGKVVYDPMSMVHIIICNEDMPACNSAYINMITRSFRLDNQRCDISSPTLYYAVH